MLLYSLTLCLGFILVVMFGSRGSSGLIWVLWHSSYAISGTGEECIQKFFSVDSANVGPEANALLSVVWISP